MKYPLTLDYTVPFGALAPYADAVKEGQALASLCAACKIVAFPPRTTCASCGTSKVEWQALSGKAQIVHRTDGSTGSFALVQFEGADTRSTVALRNPEIEATSGWLVPPPTDRPGLWVALGNDTKGRG